MAKARQCDRCGKYYLESDANPHIYSFPFRVPDGCKKDRFCIFIYARHVNSITDHYFDLCPDCRDALYRFIKNLDN